MFLEVMTFARYVRGDFDPTRKAHACNFTESRIRLLGRVRVYASADASSLRGTLKSRGLGLGGVGFPAFAD